MATNENTSCTAERHDETPSGKQHLVIQSVQSADLLHRTQSHKKLEIVVYATVMTFSRNRQLMLVLEGLGVPFERLPNGSG